MEDFLWPQKYRPKTVADTILPKQLKQTFQTFVDNKNVPNLILSGGAGVGKTTVAKAMLEELGCDYLLINGSLNGNIDTLRNDIANFAGTVSFTGGRKYVILDEADYLGGNVQAALRNFMEEYSKNCGFILTCNFPNKIIQPLHSRCSVIQFDIATADKPRLAGQFFKRVIEILNLENVIFNEETVARTIEKYFPDWRRVLNELQRYSATGKIDEVSMSASASAAPIEELVELIKAKSFNDARKWVSSHSDIDTSALFRGLYNILPTKIKSTSSLAEAIIVLAEYEYKEAFVANPEINRVAAIATLMATVTEWK
jgi:DNA polymerase III delta prime subunit